MSSRCDFLLKFFGDRFILLKEDWLTTCVDYLNQRVPGARSFSDERFADLVLDQWSCSNIESTSYPTFGNHGFDGNTKKCQLQGPIVCQVNSFIDTGSPYYAQFTNLSGKSTNIDRTGFEKVFHEKQDDYDKKPSRLLKLTLTDGETPMIAIEFWKCPQLSLYHKPGVKILIQPPCLIRNGAFLLKPGNCKILGGQVLPLLNSRRPVDQYARILGVKGVMTDRSDSVEQRIEPISSQMSQNPSIYANSQTSTSTSSTIRVPPGPTPLLAKYFAKSTVSNPPTSKPSENREISPDPFSDDVDIDNDDEIADDDWEDPNLFSDVGNRRQSTSTPIRPAEVTVRSLLSRKNVEMEDFETKRTPRSPQKRKSVQTPPNETARIPGMLTSRRMDPEDEILENMIEDGEEPVKSPEKPKKSVPNMFRRRSPIRKSPIMKQPTLKKIKLEEDSDDDDIQIIEISPPIKREKEDVKMEKKKLEVEENENRENLAPEKSAALEAFSKLKFSTFSESRKRMKYSIGSRRFWHLAIIENIPDPVRIVDNLWTVKVEMADETGDAAALIDNSTLENLIGFTCQEAIAIHDSSDMMKREDGKRRLDALEDQLQRLDLVFEIEFFAGATSSIPVIRSMKTLAEHIDVF